MNLLKIACAVIFASPLAACAGDIAFIPLHGPGIYKVSAGMTTPGAVITITPDQHIAAVGGDGIVGDVLHGALPSVASMLAPAPNVTATAVVQTTTNVTVGSGL